MFIGDDNDLQILFACGEFHRFDLHLAGLLTTLPGFDELMATHHLCHTLLSGIVRSKKFACGWVGEMHTPIRICDEYAISELFQHRGETFILSAECGEFRAECSPARFDHADQFIDLARVRQRMFQVTHEACDLIDIAL